MTDTCRSRVISLAYAEIYLTFARLLRSFDMKLFNTALEDVQIHKAFVIGQPRISKEKGEGQGEVKVDVISKLCSPSMRA